MNIFGRFEDIILTFRTLIKGFGRYSASNTGFANFLSHLFMSLIIFTVLIFIPALKEVFLLRDDSLVGD